MMRMLKVEKDFIYNYSIYGGPIVGCEEKVGSILSFVAYVSERPLEVKKTFPNTLYGETYSPEKKTAIGRILHPENYKNKQIVIHYVPDISSHILSQDICDSRCKYIEASLDRVLWLYDINKNSSRLDNEIVVVHIVNFVKSPSCMEKVLSIS